MVKRKTNRKISPKTTVPTKSAANTSYSRRTRKRVNYVDQDDDKDSESEFEAEYNKKSPTSESDEDMPLINISKRSASQKKQKLTKIAAVADTSPQPNAETNETSETSKYFGSVLGSQPGIICKPNLSEDESSDSSDDETPDRARFKTVPQNGVKNVSNYKDEEETSDVKKNDLESVFNEPVSFENAVSTAVNPNEENANLQPTFDVKDTNVSQLASQAKRPKRTILHSIDDTKPTKAMKLEIKDCKTTLINTNTNGRKSLVEHDKKSTNSSSGSRDKLRLKKKSSKKFEELSHSLTNQDNSMNVDEDHKFSSDDAEESESWEDVDEAKIKLSPKKRKKSKKSETKEDTKDVEEDMKIKDVQISVGVKSIHKKKMSREEKMRMWLRQVIGRFQRERQVLIHKCHLLSLFARELQNNIVCNSKLLQGICLSLLPIEFMKPVHNKWDISHLRKLLQWFQKDIPSISELILFTDEVVKQLKNLTRAHVFVMLLRSLGFTSRIIVSLQPCTSKVRQAESLRNSPEASVSSQPTTSVDKTENHKSKTTVVSKKEAEETPKKVKHRDTKNSGRKQQKKAATTQSKYFKKEEEEDSPTVKTKTKKNKSHEKTSPVDGMKQYRHRNIQRISYKEGDVDEGSEDNGIEENRVVKQSSGNKRKKSNESSSSKSKIEDDSDDDDFDLSDEMKRSQHQERRKSTIPKTHSSSSVNNSKKSKRKSTDSCLGVDTWIEVYLKNMNDWITIEITTESINEVSNCEQVATKPLQYVVAIDNDQQVKDVTCRYADKWLSYNRKLRIDRDWWAQTIAPYAPPDDALNRAEDAKLKKRLLEQDFPKTISEFKDNPLYALQRHLLKFQAIYPESAVPLGYIRNEPIYSRDCVHELHTRETWMKQARTVRAGEVAYKTVKGRPKRNTPEHLRDSIKVEVFGLWQTEVYIPPPVKDGKVPKNEYGNVELFKPSMLPEGAVHLPMTNMQKIARKLKIDFAPAMMGWDFHGGWSHPVIEGIVVAKEFEDKLLDAWRKDEEEQQKKDKEKREKIIYENWKTLIRGILIRHKLKNKYKLTDDELMASASPSNKKSTTTKTKTSTKKKNNKTKPKTKTKDEYSDLSVSWPMNRMDGKTSLADEGHVHVFPESSYEKEEASGVLMKTCSCGLRMPVDNEEQL